MSAKSVLRLNKKKLAMERQANRPSDEELEKYHKFTAERLEVVIANLTEIVLPLKLCYYPTSPQSQCAESVLRKLVKLKEGLESDRALIYPDGFILI